MNDGRYEPITADKNIEIRSVNGAGTTVIDASLQWPRGVTNRCATLSDAGLVGICLTNGVARDGGGVYGGWLDQCFLNGNTATNDGGGAYNSSLSCCVVSGNTAARYGGGSCKGWLNNCVLSGNTATSGGGAYNGYLNNCTLYGNMSTVDGVGGAQTSSAGWLNNCIIWGNTANGRENCDVDAYPRCCQYNCLGEVFNGIGNIVADPRFVDAANGDFRLRAGSPCIDAGTNKWCRGSSFYDLDSYSEEFPGTSTDDAAGNPRILGGRMDMGAYEFDPSNPFPGGDQAEIVNGIEWVFSIADGEATVTCANPRRGGLSGDVVIPYTLGGRPVTGILREAFWKRSDMTSVTMPDSVVHIGDQTFYGCTGLVSMVIPDGVAHIGWQAFYACTGLVSVAVPASVTNSGEHLYHVFGDCRNIREVVWPGTLSLSDAIPRAGLITNAVVAEGSPCITASTFSGCTKLTSITIPDSVTNIASHAFSDCTRLESIAIPDALLEHLSSSWEDLGLPQHDCQVVLGSGYVLRYDSGAFIETVDNIAWRFTIWDGQATITGVDGQYTGGSYNANLRGDIVLPSSLAGYPVTGIGQEAFANQPHNMTSVTIPNGVTSIGERAFFLCRELTGVTIPDSVTSIGDEAFHSCYSLKSATIPPCVTNIGMSAFFDCEGLTSLTIPNSVTGIELHAFCNCDMLADVTVPGRYGLLALTGHSVSSLTNAVIAEGATCVNGWSFYDFTNLTSITIPNSVEEIGECAFYGCGKLASVTIPDDVTVIESSVFCGCSSLQFVSIPDNVECIGSDAFMDSGLTRIIIPDALSGQESSWRLPSGCKVVLRSELAGKKTADGVPYEWFYQNGTPFLDATVDDDCEAAAQLTAFNGVNKVWECYVAGLDPTNTTARFEATITMDANGKPHVAWNPPLPAAEAAKREYRILGAKSLGGEWDDVTDTADPDAEGYRFFKVKVRMGD